MKACNDRSRSFLIALSCAISLAGWCQERADAAGSFAHLSAKERTRLAKEEEREAATDDVYIELMAGAERLFKEQRFDEAMVSFEEARQRRPLNVYPKVKIDDLRVLISKRDAALQGTGTAVDTTIGPMSVPSPLEAPEGSATGGVAAVLGAPRPLPVQPTSIGTVEGEPSSNEKPSTRPVAIHVGQTAHNGAPRAKVATKPISEAPNSVVERPGSVQRSLSDGVEEERFKEGQALVLQRTCRSGQLVQVFRKVDHPWGKTFYFLDGLPVQERVWTDRFGDR